MRQSRYDTKDTVVVVTQNPPHIRSFKGKKQIEFEQKSSLSLKSASARDCGTQYHPDGRKHVVVISLDKLHSIRNTSNLTDLVAETIILRIEYLGRHIVIGKLAVLSRPLRSQFVQLPYLPSDQPSIPLTFALYPAAEDP